MAKASTVVECQCEPHAPHTSWMRDSHVHIKAGVLFQAQPVCWCWYVMQNEDIVQKPLTLRAMTLAMMLLNTSHMTITWSYTTLRAMSRHLHSILLNCVYETECLQGMPTGFVVSMHSHFIIFLMQTPTMTLSQYTTQSLHCPLCVAVFPSVCWLCIKSVLSVVLAMHILESCSPVPQTENRA